MGMSSLGVEQKTFVLRLIKTSVNTLTPIYRHLTSSRDGDSSSFCQFDYDFLFVYLTTALALGVSLDPFNQKITLIDDQVDTADSPVKCKLQNSTRPPAFSMDGDYIIGGIFSIHSYIHTVDSNYTTMPEPVR